MKLRPFRGIGGLVLHAYDDDQPTHGHGNMMLAIPRSSLSAVAVAAIQEIGLDASDALCDLCCEIADIVREKKS